MVTINEVLNPGESVLKHQQIDSPLGNLYLTNQRVIFLSLVQILGSDNFIPLSTIHSLRKNLGFLVIESNTEHSYLVTFFSVGGWVDAIQQASTRATSHPPTTYEPGLTPPKPSRQTSSLFEGKRCPTCQNQLVYLPKYQRHYCNTCQQYVP